MEALLAVIGQELVVGVGFSLTATVGTDYVGISLTATVDTDVVGFSLTATVGTDYVGISLTATVGTDVVEDLLGLQSVVVLGLQELQLE